MDTARIAELLEPFLRAPVVAAKSSSHDSDPAKAGAEPTALSRDQLQHISTYIDILLRWNARVNLTAIRKPEDIVTRHFGESLFAARCLTANASTRDLSAERSPAALTLADIGSGAGFPGLPIKLWAPAISVTLVESSHKKAAFLREIVRALTLTNVDIQNIRAETLRARFDIIIMRAVERFEAILPIAVGLVAPAGRLALLIGNGQEDQVRSMLADLRCIESVPIPHSHSRILLVAHQRPDHRS